MQHFLLLLCSVRLMCKYELMIIQEVNKSSLSFLLLRHVLISSEENKFICEMNNLSVESVSVCTWMCHCSCVSGVLYVKFEMNLFSVILNNGWLSIVIVVLFLFVLFFVLEASLRQIPYVWKHTINLSLIQSHSKSCFVLQCSLQNEKQIKTTLKC